MSVTTYVLGAILLGLLVVLYASGQNKDYKEGNISFTTSILHTIKAGCMQKVEDCD